MAGKPPDSQPLVNRGSLVVVVCAFVCSRVLYFLAGVDFDVSPLRDHWQLIDPQLMQTDLLRSLFYLHMQPPGFNLLVGMVVKFLPNGYATAFHILYLSQGLLVAVLLLRLMRMLGVASSIATAVTTLFVISPGCVLFENILAYEYVVLLLLLLAAICLLRLYESRVMARALAFFGCLFGLMMIRNSFHTIYFLAVAAALLWTLPEARRTVLIAASLFLVPVLALQLKNWILFGTFSLSMWAGMATGVVTTFQLTPQECDALIERGVVTRLARVPPFSQLSEYADFVQKAPPTGIPVLDAEITSTGHANFNNPAYLQLHSQYVANAKAVLLHYPVAYARSQAIAWFTYFLPASEMHYFDATREKINGWERAFNVIVFGQMRHAANRSDLRAIKASGNALSLVLYTGVFLMVLLPMLVFWAAREWLLPGRRRLWGRPQLVTLGFMVFTIVFITGLSNSLSTFESNRYRFPLDGFYVTLFGLLATRVMTQRVRPISETHVETADSMQ